jgi:hypothetical protein
MVATGEEQGWYALNRFGSLRITQRQTLDARGSMENSKLLPSMDIQTTVVQSTMHEPALASPACTVNSPQPARTAGVAVGTSSTSAKPLRLARSASQSSTPVVQNTGKHEVDAKFSATPYHHPSHGLPPRSKSLGAAFPMAKEDDGLTHRHSLLQAKTFVRKLLSPAAAVERGNTLASQTAKPFKVRLQHGLWALYIQNSSAYRCLERAWLHKEELIKAPTLL